MTPPDTIHILSDDTELEFVGTLTASVSKVKLFQYHYVKSISKYGQLLELTEDQLLSLIKVNTP